KIVVVRHVALVDTAVTVTLSGTLAAFDGSAAKETSTSEGAGMFRVTAPSTELPPTTLAEFKLTEKSAGFSAALIPATTSNKNKHETTVLKLRIRLLYEASWKTMCTTAVESTGRPSCNAGLNLICSSALTACSSNPWPSPCTTLVTCIWPLLVKHTSSRTS